MDSSAAPFNPGPPNEMSHFLKDQSWLIACTPERVNAMENVSQRISSQEL